MPEKYEQLKWEIICTGNEVMISDTNIKIQELYGGFGQGQKILTVQQIAMLHVDDPTNKEEIRNKVKRINELINNNIILDSGDQYFEFGIDIIDLKSEDVLNDHGSIIRSLIQSKVYTQNSVNRATNLYILSEQGYSLLINLMSDTKSKIIYKRVIRDYFRMKEQILSSEDAAQYMMRLLGKQERKKTTDMIKYFIERGDIPHDPKDIKRNAYARETNFVYKLLFGMTAKDIESYLGLTLKPNDTIRNYISLDDVDIIRDIEGRIGYMQQDNKSYQEIHSRLKELYPTPKKPRLADKNVTLIKRLIGA
jgi:hypothetical protein